MLRYIKAGINVLSKPSRVSERPIHIQIEPTDACNLDCSFCARSKVIKKARLMSLEEFKKIFDTIRPKKVTLSGLGEPLLNPEFPDMVIYAKSHGASVNTTTNMTRMDESKAERLIKSQLDLINVSIDAATPETYILSRGEDFFYKILDGVRLLIEAKVRMNSRKPFVRISFVIHKGNLHEVSDFGQLARNLGVDVAYYQILALTALYERQDNLIVGVPYTQFEHALREGLAHAKQLGVKTNLPWLLADLGEYWEKYGPGEDRHRRQCILPWFSTYITADGSVRPCCRFAPVTMSMGGSMLENDFGEIWNSVEYQRFRAAHKAGGRPTRVCRECVPEDLLDIAQRIPYSPGFFVDQT